MKEENHRTIGHGMLFFVLAAGFVLVALAIMFAPRPDVKITTSGDSTGQGAMQNTISVSGTAELTVSPDEADVYIRISTDEPTARRAQEENARLTNTVKAALKKEYNLNDEDIESTSYNLWPQQRWDKDTEEQKITSYKVQHLLKINTDELDKIGDMLDTAVQNGANGIDRIQFKLSKDFEADVRDQALGRAAGAAKDKADSLATTLGIRIGGVSSVQESNFYYQPYDYTPRANVAMDMGGMEEKAYGGSSISPQDVTVRANLNVAYEIA